VSADRDGLYRRHRDLVVKKIGQALTDGEDRELEAIKYALDVRGALADLVSALDVRDDGARPEIAAALARAREALK